jgi:hypothetical protein
MTRVDVVLDTDNIPVPVPKGFTASGATGEHTVNTGFVIYEGTGEINDDNAWDESCTRNQFVWVPVPDPSRVYEEIGTRKKIVKLGKIILGCKKEIEILQSLEKKIELKKRGQGEIEFIIHGKKERSSDYIIK